MPLEGLSREDLGEQIRRVSLARDMFNGNTPSAAKLAHLEELAVDVAGVSGSGIAMAKVMGSLAVSADLDRALLNVAKECHNL